MNIIPLSKVRGEDVPLCGVKGAQLGELMSIGLPVPDGFIVTTEAYRLFMEESSLDEEIAEMISQVSEDDHGDLSAISESVQNLMNKVEIGKKLSNQVLKSFRRLGATYVAVRGSTSIKEKPLVYFDGRVATSLNVKEETLLTNIEYCWSSLYSSRCLEFVFKEDMVDEVIYIAVVIQKMVNAESSGICYTIDPDGKKEGVIVIQAGWGLGEGVVSGIISPDRYIVDKESLKVVDVSVGEQMKEVTRDEQRHKIIDVPKKKQKARKIKDEQVIELARLATQVEEYYGVPQQLEWAFDNSLFSILQTRRIPDK